MSSKSVFKFPPPLKKAAIAMISGAIATISIIDRPPLADATVIDLSTLERGIIAEMNRARSNPPAYSQVMLNWRKKFQGNLARISPTLFLRTKEGTPAIDEAIRVLKKTRPVPTLAAARGLSLAARDHVRDQGNRGAIGHNGRDGSTPYDRMERYGKWQVIAGENIAYGPDTAQAVVRDLIIDDGVADRGHRINMFQPKYRVAGVACGRHKRYRVMCAIEYAGSYQDKK